jgi:hypothetical protein
VMLISILPFLMSLTGCSKKLATPLEPKHIWTVEKDVASTPYFDGVCGKSDEYLLVRYK